MRNIRFAGILVLVAVLMSMAFSANAAGAGPTIRANETFDGTAVFLNQDWGLTGGWVSTAPDAPITRANRTLKTVQTGYGLTPGVTGTSLTLGLSLAYIDGASTTTSTDVTDPDTGVVTKVYTRKTRVPTNTGTVSTERAFSGTKSLKLSSGTLCEFPSGEIDEAGINNQPWFWQFALASGPTTGMSAGTVVGRFKMNFSTDWTDLGQVKGTTTNTVTVDAVTNASGNVDVKVVPSNKVIGTIAPVTGSWALISVMLKLDCTQTTVTAIPTANNWGAFDACTNATTITKGPMDLYKPVQTTTSLYYSGVTIYCNSKNKSAYLSPLDLAPTTKRWGTGNNGVAVTTSTLYYGRTTTIKSWGLYGVGGAIYVDNLLWGFPPSGRASFQDPNGAGNYIGQEMAARMKEFNAVGVEAPAAGVKVWNVY